MPGHGRSFNIPANVKLIRITQNGIGMSRRFSMALATKAPATGIMASRTISNRLCQMASRKPGTKSQ